jgi:ABC-type dipeptide/oligopeptide/nickel transport system permease subunit
MSDRLLRLRPLASGETGQRALGGAAVVATLLVAAGLGSLLGSPLWARALRATLLDSAMVIAVALGLGLPLGFIAGSGVRLAQRALSRAVEIAAALPAAVFAAALLGERGRFAVAALGLGLLKGIEFGWLLRGRLSAERGRLHLADQSKARLPFSVYYRRALPRALGPSLVSLALTPVWISLVDMCAFAIAAAPLSRRISLGTAAARGSALAALAIAVLTLGLYAIARYFAARFAGQDDESDEPLPLPLSRPSRPPETSS